MKNIRLYLSVFVAALMLPINLSGANENIPLSYYASIDGKAGADLKNAVYNLIRNHQKVSSYSALPEYFKKTDVRPGTNFWWDMYSNLDINISWSFGRYMNREHSFPKSWWGGGDQTPAYTDLYHLYPGEAEANMAKSNYPLGEVSRASFDNGVTRVGTAVSGQGGGAPSVFEPDDEYKGDFARTYFYVVTCYQDLVWAPKYMYMLEQNAYPTLRRWAIDLLLKWARNDEVSQKETERNEAVYKIQNNRNPFIDFPELAEYIWGNKVGQKFSLGAPVGKADLITPVQNNELDFGQVAVDHSLTRELIFMGNNLTKSLTLNKMKAKSSDPDYLLDQFELSSNSLDAKLVNRAGGFGFPITYKPNRLGTHEIKLLISDGGIDASRGVYLRGECLEVPTFSRIKALPPTDVKQESYVANWEVPSMPQVIDYYNVEITKYINGVPQGAPEVLPAETNFLLVEDYGEYDAQSYVVKSVRLYIESPASDPIFVDHAGVTGVNIDSSLNWNHVDGGVQLVSNRQQTNVRVYDVAGRVASFIPAADNGYVIELPTGIYMIATDQQANLVKAVVK